MADTRFQAGYSATPLPKKLGIKPGLRIAVVDPPDGFLDEGVGALPDDAVLGPLTTGATDLAIAFVLDLARLGDLLPELEAATRPDGAFWVAWPKWASGVPTDVTEDRVRELALPRGNVDVKVCAIDATWSALRLCLRRELR